MENLRWIEPATMAAWVASGAVVIHAVGEENVYATDEFGYTYFAKMDPPCCPCGATVNN